MNKVEENYTSSRLFTSKIHNFENLPEPRNATEAFHSKLYDFNIPNDINDFNKSNSSKVITTFEDSNKKLSKLFKKLQINSNDDEKEITQQQIKRQSINVDDEDEVYNNLNLHSKEQDELEIPDDEMKEFEFYNIKIQKYKDLVIDNKLNFIKELKDF
ncbi:hypothetical protein RhiirA1_445091 [Rhizophagus irregularis]|uniref:Uncharacterized protein n=1 Tax=Rhizophagus irregularis TaxID=588596 RepID=A0A2N0R9X8_9GLOM|nr:hypothetical protein RhiirA1_445091 [Rhizophagus irregularis]